MKAITNSASIMLLTVVAACTIAPRQEVLPYPDHIRAGVEIGDKIEITTTDGTAIETTVTEVIDDTIVGDEHRVPFSEVSSLSKRSWKPAKNPCDDGVPLGCSLPVTVRLVSEYHVKYGNELDRSCVAHDFCYRYGFETYGYDRQSCDAAFLDNMLKLCKKQHLLDPLGGTECRLASRQMHAAVVRYGEKAFQEDSSRYCEYAGPKQEL